VSPAPSAGDTAPGCAGGITFCPSSDGLSASTTIAAAPRSWTKNRCPPGELAVSGAGDARGQADAAPPAWRCASWRPAKTLTGIRRPGSRSQVSCCRRAASLPQPTDARVRDRSAPRLQRRHAVVHQALPQRRVGAACHCGVRRLSASSRKRRTRASSSSSAQFVQGVGRAARAARAGRHQRQARHAPGMAQRQFLRHHAAEGIAQHRRAAPSRRASPAGRRHRRRSPPSCSRARACRCGPCRAGRRPAR
jgi:hypothetical protein